MIDAPKIIDISVDEIKNDFKAYLQGKLRKTLQPAQVESLTIDVLSYAQNLVYSKFNECVRQTLVECCDDLMLDYHGARNHTPRLKERFAATTLEFKLEGAKDFDVTYPQGTNVEAKTGGVTFSTAQSVTIPAGELSANVLAYATEAGTAANGFDIGQICVPTDNLDYLDSVKNITVTSGGAAREGREAYRARIMEAPEKYTCAGSRGAYKFWAKSAHQSILDVAVVTPDEPAELSITLDDDTVLTPEINQIGGAVGDIGTIDFTAGVLTLNFDIAKSIKSINFSYPVGCKVDIYVLTDTFTLDDTLKHIILDKLNRDDILPTTDKISIYAAPVVNYQIALDVTLFEGADADAAKAQIGSLIKNYVAARERCLGKDVVPEKIERLVNALDIVYRAKLQPNKPQYKAVEPYQAAKCSAVTVNIGGFVND